MKDNSFRVEKNRDLMGGKVLEDKLLLDSVSKETKNIRDESDIFNPTESSNLDIDSTMKKLPIIQNDEELTGDLTSEKINKAISKLRSVERTRKELNCDHKSLSTDVLCFSNERNYNKINITTSDIPFSNEKDECVIDGVPFTYIVMKGKHIVKTKKDKKINSMLRNLDDKIQIHVPEDHVPVSDFLPFVERSQVIIVPDLFMPLESLVSLADVIDESSLALIISLPGLSRRDHHQESLDIKMCSNLIAKVIKRLDEEDKYDLNKVSYFFWYGIGIGASILLELFADEERFESFSKRSCAILSNPFINFDTKSVEKVNELKECFLTFQSSTHEQKRKILSLLYSQKFLCKYGEKYIWDKFKYSVQLLDPYLYTCWQLEAKPSESKSSLLTLLIAICKTNKSFHIPKKTICIPIYLLQSSENKLIDNMDILLHLRESLLLPVDRTSELFNKKDSFHTRWITAGHQIFDEKNSDILQILRELFDAKVKVRDGKTSGMTNKIVPFVTKIKPSNKDIYNTDFGQSSPFKHNPLENDKNISECDYSDLKDEADDEVSAFLSSTIEEKNRQIIAMQQKREEIHKMRCEDKYSFGLRNYRQKFRDSIEQGAMRQSIVRKLREKSEEKAQREIILESQKRFAYERQEARRIAHMSQKEIETAYLTIEEFHCLVDSMKKTNLPENFDMCYVNTQKCNKDLKYHSDELKLMIKVQQKAEKEANVFRLELKKVKEKSQSVCTTLKLLQAQKSIIEESDQDLQELKQRKHELSTEIEALTSVFSNKHNYLESRNRVVQLSSQILREKCELLTKIVDTFSEKEDTMCKNIENMRRQRNDKICAKYDYLNKKASIDQRLSNLSSNKSFKIVENNLVDTDLWQGIKQRMPSEEFFKRVNLERQKLQIKSTTLEQDLVKLNNDMRNMDEIVCHTEMMRLKFASIIDQSNEILNLVSTPFNFDKESKQTAGLSSSDPQGNDNILGLVRRKEDCQRTNEECEFVSIDQILFPELYGTTNERSDVQCSHRCNLGFDKEKIEKILALPEPIQFDLPFLEKFMEIKCHMLVNKYYRRISNEYFERIDKMNKTHLVDRSFQLMLNNSGSIETREAKQLFKMCKANLIASSLHHSELDLRLKHWEKVQKILQPTKEYCSNDDDDDDNDAWEPHGHDDASLRELMSGDFSKKRSENDKYIYSLIEEFYVGDDTTFDSIKNLDISIIYEPRVNSIVPTGQVSIDSRNPQYNQQAVKCEKLDPFVTFVKDTLHNYKAIKSKYPPSDSKKSITKNLVLPNIDSVLDIKDHIFEYDMIYIDSNTEMNLSSVPAKIIERGCKETHRFYIQNTPTNKLSFIKFCIIYQGKINRSEYLPGRISASLGYLSETQFMKPSGSSMINLIPVGYAPYEFQSTNSNKNLGYLTIQHSPSSGIESGLFELTVVAESETKYSISVIGKFANLIEDTLFQKVCTYIKHNKLVDETMDVICSINYDLRVAERTVQLIQKLIREAEEESNRCEKDIELCEREMEDDRLDFARDETKQRCNDMRVCGSRD